MIETLLGKAAYALCNALHKSGPALLGKEIAGIVEKHAIGAAAAGLGAAWIPGVGGTAAVVASAGFIWSMYYRINSKIGVPFNKNILKSVATAICTNLVATAVSSIVVSSLLTFVPGLGTLAGDLIMTAVSFALVWSSGLVYLKVLTRFAESDVDLNSVSEEDLKAMAEEVLSKEDLKGMMKQAKQQFKMAKERGDIRKDGDHVKPMEED